LAILTTAPGQWIPCCSSLEATIMDLGEVFSGTVWSTEAELKDRFVAKLQSAGWSNELIKLETRLAKTEGKARNVRPDVLLLHDDRKPLVVIEMKNPTVAWADALTQARLNANDIGAPHASVWDGVEIQIAKGRLQGLPSPVQLRSSSPPRSEIE